MGPRFLFSGKDRALYEQYFSSGLGMAGNSRKPTEKELRKDLSDDNYKKMRRALVLRERGAAMWLSLIGCVVGLVGAIASPFLACPSTVFPYVLLAVTTIVVLRGDVRLVKATGEIARLVRSS